MAIYSKNSLSLVDILSNLSTKTLNNLIVANVSFNALCAHSNSSHNEVDKYSKLRDFSSFNKKLANSNVSSSKLFFNSTQLLLKNQVSNLVLCHNTGKSQINSSTSEINSFHKGESLTSLSVILVILVIKVGISISGLTKKDFCSIISKVFSSNLTSHISIILSTVLSSHVVSKSNATIILLLYFKIF
jgi:hypothetical protein